MKRRFLILTVVGCWLAAGLTQAQETSDDTKSEPAARELTAEEQQKINDILAERAGLNDDAFDQFVSLDLIQEAYELVDVELAIDCALQLGHGERVLLRQHRSGITPSDLLRFATNAAATKKDAAMFDRLQEAARSLELNELDAVIRVAKKTAGQPRDASKNLGKYEVFREAIEHAGLTGNLAQLDAMLEGLPEDLSVQQRTAITDMIAEWRSKAADGETDSPLSKLTAPSRFWAHTFTSSGLPAPFGNTHMWPWQRIDFLANFAVGSPSPYYLRVDCTRGSVNIESAFPNLPWIKSTSSLAGSSILTKRRLTATSPGFASIRLRAKFVCGPSYQRTTTYRYINLIAPVD
jgi:hypothetical protein